MIKYPQSVRLIYSLKAKKSLRKNVIFSRYISIEKSQQRLHRDTAIKYYRQNLVLVIEKWSRN
jgi:hypothetical protein